MAWIDDGFPKLLSREERVKAGLKAIEALRAMHSLNGFDENVLREWVDAGCTGKMPQLSHELRAGFEGDERAARAEAEAAGLHNWLAAGLERQKALEERRLKREYPISYPAWLEECAVRKQQRMLELQEVAKAHAEQKRKEWESQQELERHRRDINARMWEYLKMPGSPMELNSAEYMEWCEAIATEAQLELLDQRLLQDAKRGSGDNMSMWAVLRGVFGMD